MKIRNDTLNAAFRDMMACLIPLILALTVSCSGPSAGGTGTTDDIVLLTSQCEYRLGDSPLDRNGTFLWTGDAGEKGWMKCDGMLRIKPTEKERFIWYRFRIPSCRWKSPRILVIAKAIESAQIYINKKMAFSFGEGKLNRESAHAAGSWHMLPAPKDCFGPYLYLRIHSTIMAKGFFGKIYMGSFGDLYQRILLADIYKLGLVLFYLIISVFTLGVFIARRDRYEYLAFSVLIVSIALLTFELCLSAQLLFPVTLHHWKLWAASVLLGTPSMGAFLEHTFHERYRRLFRRLWQSFLIYGLAAYLGDLLGIVPLYYPVIILMMLSVPIMLFLYVIVMRASFRGDTTARIFFAGMSVFLILMMIDYVRFFNQIHLANSPIILGTFVLVMSMGIILIQKFGQTYRDLQDLTVNLADKVEERTAELQEANRRLEKNDGEKTAFFTNLAHEIKTPLTLIVNALRSYIVKYGMSPELEPVSRNLDLLLRDINNFFDVMKWERGIDVYRHDRLIDLSDFTGKKIELFRSTAAGRGIAVDSSIEERIVLRADPSGIDRLLNNLLDNALKYNAEGGSITVTLGRKGGDIVLSVSDTGAGIKTGKHEAIFLPYHRLSDTSKQAGGIGMGLAIVKNIVTSLKGDIRVEDNQPRGARFIVTLPAPEDIVDRSEIQDVGPEDTLFMPFFYRDRGAAEAPTEKDGLPAIFIVEDNHELVNLMKRELGSHFRVSTAFEGGEALEKLPSMPPPSLIISDIMMEGMDGFQFLERVRQDPRLKSIPFLFLTARNLNADRVRAHELGALDYIYKPFYMEELIAKINSIITFQNIRKEMAEKEKFASLGMMLAGISHEIFNPLSGISGPLELLKNRIGPVDDNATKYILHIEQSVNRIEGIIRNLKDLYREERLPMAEVSLGPVIEKSWDYARAEHSRDIILETDLDEGKTVMAHEFSLIQIFTNLFKNAMEAMEPGGIVQVRWEERNGSPALVVEDNGRGIDATALERVFDPFYTSGTANRMGMGLFIVKNLAERMQWGIELRSEPGRGTAVTFTLPSR